MELNNENNARIINKSVAKIEEINILGSYRFKCTICINEISEEEGQLKCGHRFCFDCISNWVKNVNTCPLCKIEIFKIDFYRSNKFIEETLVNRNRLSIDSEMMNIDTNHSFNNCEICTKNDNSHALLICDECHRCFHK